MDGIVACTTCGKVQRVPPLPRRATVFCARCGFRLLRRHPDSRNRTLALSLAALVLYGPANVYPIAIIDYMGNHIETTILGAIIGLFRSGSQLVALLIFTTSVLTPALKIVGLILLALTARSTRRRRFRTWVYKTILWIDPWNMLEVFLLAILVSVAELGRIATVEPGFGLFSFAGVVVLTIWASLCFDPRLIWDAPLESRRDERSRALVPVRGA